MPYYFARLFFQKAGEIIVTNYKMTAFLRSDAVSMISGLMKHDSDQKGISTISSEIRFYKESVCHQDVR